MAAKFGGMTGIVDNTHATAVSYCACHSVNDRRHAPTLLIASDSCRVEIDHDERGLLRLNGLKCMQAPAPADDLVDNLLWYTARMFHAPVFTRFEIYIKSPSALRIQFVVAQEVKRVQKSSLFPSGSITRKSLILPSKSSGGDWTFIPLPVISSCKASTSGT
jgi:hypothetical protein